MIDRRSAKNCKDSDSDTDRQIPTDSDSDSNSDSDIKRNNRTAKIRIVISTAIPTSIRNNRTPKIRTAIPTAGLQRFESDSDKDDANDSDTIGQGRQRIKDDSVYRTKSPDTNLSQRFVQQQRFKEKIQERLSSNLTWMERPCFTSKF